MSLMYSSRGVSSHEVQRILSYLARKWNDEDLLIDFEKLDFEKLLAAILEEDGAVLVTRASKFIREEMDISPGYADLKKIADIFEHMGYKTVWF